MDIQAWIGIGTVTATTIGAVWTLTIRYSVKMAVLKEKQRLFEEAMKEKIKEVAEEYEKKITELRKEMELHEAMNDKTFHKIFEKLDQLTSKLDELFGWLKGSNKQGL